MARYNLASDPSFQMGMALGNAYGNMWAAKAQNRQEEQMDDFIRRLEQQDQIANIANMTPQQQAMQQIGGYANQLNPAQPQQYKLQSPMLNQFGGQNPIQQQNYANQLQTNPAQGLQALNQRRQAVEDFAKRNKFNSEVVNPRLASFDKAIAEKANYMLPDIYKGLYNFSGKSDEVIDLMGKIDEYARYNPEGANRLKAMLPSAMDMFRYRENKKQGSRPQYRISDAVYNNAVKEYNNLVSNIGYADNQYAKDYGNRLMGIINAYEVERGVNSLMPEQQNAQGGSKQDTITWNPADWDSVRENIKRAIDEGTSPQDAFAGLAEAGVTDPEILKKAKNYTDSRISWVDRWLE